MDYLEGFLIGPVWSDTDYRTRRHLNAHILLAAFMAAAFVMLNVFPAYYSKVVRIDWPLSLVLLLSLIILTPALSIFYRRLPLYVRPLLLIVYAAKYLLLFYVLVQIFLPLVTFENESIRSMLYERVDDHIGTALEVIAQSGGILVTAVGVVAGGLWILGEGLALVAILILVPLLAIALFKGIQYGLDRLTQAILDRQLQGIDYYIPVAPVPPDLDPKPPDGLSSELFVPDISQAPQPAIQAEPGEEVESGQPARRIPIADKLPVHKRVVPDPRVKKGKKRASFKRYAVRLKEKSKGLASRLALLVRKAAAAIQAWLRTFGAFVKKTVRRVKEGVGGHLDKAKVSKKSGHVIRQVQIPTPLSEDEGAGLDEGGPENDD